MKKRNLAFVLLGLLAMLVIPLSFGTAAAQEQSALPPSHPMPFPYQPAVSGIVNADNSPARILICPEVIWAPATGGGTWMSRLQVTAQETGAIVQANFFYGTSQTGYYTLFTSTSTSGNESKTYPNILSTLGTLAGLNLYGYVGTLVLTTQSTSYHIIADVETMNGNYGKSFPAVQWIDNASFNYGRSYNCMIQDISNDATWRTGVGVWNGSAYNISVTFYVIGSTWTYYGSTFSYTLAPWQFVSFNPFVQAGLGASSLDGYRLWGTVTSTTQPSPYSLGLFIYGSKANNLTNDSAALFFRPY
jgi:hypothetical protein